MAVGAFQFFDEAKLDIVDGTIDLDGDTIAAVLLGSGYGFDATDLTFADIQAQEIADADYAPRLLTGAALSRIGGTGKFVSDKVSFGSSVTITAKWLVLLQSPGSPQPNNADLLIGVVDLDNSSGSATVASTNGEFSYTPHATNGWFTFS